MKAITYTNYGPPEVLKVEDVPEPVPQDDEVLIRVRAAEATKADVEMRTFNFSVKWFWLPLRLAIGVTKPRRRILGGFNRELLALADKARAAEDFGTIDDCHAQLSRFVDRIIRAAGDGHINAQEFNLFNFTYEAVEDAIRDREHQLEREGIAPKKSTAGQSTAGSSTDRQAGPSSGEHAR